MARPRITPIEATVLLTIHRREPIRPEILSPDMFVSVAKKLLKKKMVAEEGDTLVTTPLGRDAFRLFMGTNL